MKISYFGLLIQNVNERYEYCMREILFETFQNKNVHIINWYFSVLQNVKCIS